MTGISCVVLPLLLPMALWRGVLGFAVDSDPRLEDHGIAHHHHRQQMLRAEERRTHLADRQAQTAPYQACDFLMNEEELANEVNIS
jgi:hypothetical protein